MDEAAPPPTRGFRESASGALNSGASLTRARIELFRLEADEAQVKLVTISRFAAFGVVLFTVGYGLLLAALTHIIAQRWLEGHWEVLLCIVAALHLSVGALLLFAYRARLRRAHFFEATLNQFDTDRQWLNELQKDLKKRS